MKLQEFSVSNYRSILTTEKFTLDNLTVLVGPNNEGKSNLLRALDLGITCLRNWAQLPPDYTRSTAAHETISRRRLRGRAGQSLMTGYDFEADFPRNHKNYSDGSGKTHIRLTFALTTDEAKNFKEVTGSQNNGVLPIELTLTKQSAKLAIKKPGRGNSVLAAKSVQIAQRVVDALDFHYIPALRSSENVTHLVSGLVRRQLRFLELEEEYSELVRGLEELRNQAMSKIDQSLARSLKSFLPDLKSIRLETQDSRDILRVSDLLLDDGVETSLASKGDGIQSLAAIALMQETAASTSGAETLILAVEEPESHLHPDAVHQVRRRLLEIAQRQQIVISTHSPLLVNLDSLQSNIIVQKNKARSAQSRTELRECLGVRFEDNLHAVDATVLVEGLTDEKAIKAYLAHYSPSIKTSIHDGRIVFQVVRGAGKLENRLAALRSALTKTFVLFDRDQSGERAINDAVANGMTTSSDCAVFSSIGLKESELEDMYSTQVTENAIRQVTGLTIPFADLGKRNKKWSTRLCAALDKHGYVYDDATIESIKIAAADIAAAAPETSFHSVWSEVLVSVVERLEAQIAA